MKAAIKSFGFYILLAVVVSALLPDSAFSQEAALTATVSKNKVGVGEPFQVSYAINANISSFNEPDLRDFDVLSGPNQSSSTGIYNGRVSVSISFSYIIAARKEGKAVIPSAAVTAGGKKIQSKQLVVEVSKAGTPAAQSQRQGGSSDAQTGDYGDDIFIKCEVNKTRAFTGEQILATYKIYTRLAIIDNALSQMPILNGFWSEDVTPKDKTAQLHNEIYEGVTYQVAELKKMVLFPQRSGTLEIDPLALDCIIRQQVRPRSNNILDQFFGGGYRDVKVSVKSRPVKIEVTALPEANKPADFTGAVGNFAIESSISKEQVKADEAVNLKLTITGKGNLKLIDPIKPKFPADIETYDPNLTDKVSVTANGMSGSRTYDYLLIPRQAGEFNITPFNFSYFDPEKRTYITLNSPEFKLNVERGTSEPATVVHARNKEDVQVVGNDIRFIKTSTSELEPIETNFFGSATFYSMFAAPPLLFALFMLVYRRRQSELSDVIALKSKKAGQVARKRLTAANDALKKKDHKFFYEEIYRALNGYFSDKLHLSVSGLSKEAIASSLESRGGSPETVALLVKTLDECEIARYAPISDLSGMEHVYSDAERLIKSTEQEIG